MTSRKPHVLRVYPHDFVEHATADKKNGRETNTTTQVYATTSTRESLSLPPIPLCTTKPLSPRHLALFLAVSLSRYTSLVRNTTLSRTPSLLYRSPGRSLSRSFSQSRSPSPVSHRARLSSSSSSSSSFTSSSTSSPFTYDDGRVGLDARVYASRQDLSQ